MQPTAVIFLRLQNLLSEIQLRFGVVTLVALTMFVAPSLYGQHSYTINFHSYPSCVYGGETINCPRGPDAVCGGIGTDTAVQATEVLVGHAPSDGQRKYFAYNAYKNG